MSAGTAEPTGSTERAQTPQPRILNIKQVVILIREEYGRDLSPNTIHDWIQRGRRKNGEIGFLRTTQFGSGSPHSIAVSDLHSFLRWLMD